MHLNISLRLIAVLTLLVSPCDAQMTLTGAGSTKGAAPFSLTYQSSAGSSSTGPTINYGTMSYGSNNSRVVVLVTWPQSASETISSVTVNGVSCSQVSGAFVQVGAGAIGASDIWISNTAVSGTSGTVSITYSAALISSGQGVALYNLQTGTPTATATAHGVANNTTTASATLTVASGNVGIGITAAWGFTGGDPTWTAGATADQDFTVGPFNVHVLVGHTTTTGSVGVTATYPAGSGAPLSLAAWGP